jgi:hypothetical protein
MTSISSHERSDNSNRPSSDKAQAASSDYLNTLLGNADQLQTQSQSLLPFPRQLSDLEPWESTDLDSWLDLTASPSYAVDNFLASGNYLDEFGIERTMATLSTPSPRLIFPSASLGPACSEASTIPADLNTSVEYEPAFVAENTVPNSSSSRGGSNHQKETLLAAADHLRQLASLLG